MIHQRPFWIQTAAASPLAFAQVREDSRLDRWVVERLKNPAHVLLIASGGCTAAHLAAAPHIGRMQLVDSNSAQLAITRLKLRLLETAAPEVRLRLLGHKPMHVEDRQARLESEFRALDLPADALGPCEYVASVGPDHAGRYEAVFAALRNKLSDQAAELNALLRLNNPAEQERRVSPVTMLGNQLDDALDSVMSLPNLVCLFGEEATRNRVQPFARHFANRIRHVLATLPADRNPYLWQVLKGQYPDGCAPDWLREPILRRLPEIAFTAAKLTDVFESEPSSFDFVHLSNILDWLSPGDAQATLQMTWRALRPGGWTIIRQLNSAIDIPNFGPMFDWLEPEAHALHARDRSFFYRALYVGRKR